MFNIRIILHKNRGKIPIEIPALHYYFTVFTFRTIASVPKETRTSHSFQLHDSPRSRYTKQLMQFFNVSYSVPSAGAASYKHKSRNKSASSSRTRYISVEPEKHVSNLS